MFCLHVKKPLPTGDNPIAVNKHILYIYIYIYIYYITHLWKPNSKRSMGRPEIRWEDDIKKDIQRLKVPNWKTFVQDRRRWKEVVGKVKTVH